MSLKSSVFAMVVHLANLCGWKKRVHIRYFREGIFAVFPGIFSFITFFGKHEMK